MNRSRTVIFTALALAAAMLVMFSEDRHTLLARLSGRVGNGYAIVTKDAGWVPSDAQIMVARRDLRAFLESRLRGPADSQEKKEVQKILARWSQYRFQALGKIVGGRRLIHLNFVIIEERYWMQNSLLGVKDGGASFWRIDFDIEPGSFSRLEINGYA